MGGVSLRLLSSCLLALTALCMACAVPPLRDAARRGDLPAVERLLAEGGVQTSARDTERALHDAARQGHADIVERLLDAGADVDARDSGQATPLMEAARGGHKACVAMLVARGASLDARDSNDRTVLHWAASERHIGVAQLLLVAGANVNARNEQLETPLFLATKERQSELVLILLGRGADVDVPDRDGRTPLLLAAREEQVELARTLLATGADPNLPDHDGTTPLAEAVNDRQRELVAMLVAAGSNANERDQNGVPLLVKAVEQRAGEIVRLLLDGGADPDARDRNGRRALHIARANQDTRSVELLLEHGADPATWAAELQNQLGDPLAYAARNGYLALARAYVEHGTAMAANAATGSPGASVAQPVAYASTGEAGGPAAPTLASKRKPSTTDLSAPFYSRRVAVVIGIDDYLDWPGLEGAEEDARRVARALRERGFDEVIELYGRQATRTRMMTVLGALLARRTDGQSLALIYFAGHGQTETLASGEKRGYVMPVDSHPDYVFATGIAMGTLRELSNRLPAKQVYYAMDSCYSGLGLTRGVAPRGDGDDYIAKLTSQRAVQMITAGSENEQVVERGGRGLFTTYFLRALAGEADFDGDGWVTASEIGTWVKPQVSAASDNRQTPQFGSLLGAGEVVFRAR